MPSSDLGFSLYPTQPQSVNWAHNLSKPLGCGYVLVEDIEIISSHIRSLLLATDYLATSSISAPSARGNGFASDVVFSSSLSNLRQRQRESIVSEPEEVPKDNTVPKHGVLLYPVSA